MLLGEEQAHFFPGIVDVALLITALLSTVSNSHTTQFLS